MRTIRIGLFFTLLVVGLGCTASAPDPSGKTSAERASVDYAIVIHGGAGRIPPDVDDSQRQAYLEGLTRALRTGQEALEGGAASLDVVELVLRVLEDDPNFNAGRGAVFNHEGQNELDASIMDGRDLSCGAVAGVRTVKNPISLARLVMTRTPHVLLAGDGAERFADETSVERVEPEYFFTEERWESLQRSLEQGQVPVGGGTVGAVVLDRRGDLAAGTSTGGLTNKRYGRVGDSPIVGAGTYADNRTCAVSCTGRGEEFIRHAVAHSVSAAMERDGASLDQEARRVVHEVLQPGEGGLIAVDRQGRTVMEFNTESMLRGVADSSGRFEVAIWK